MADTTPASVACVCGHVPTHHNRRKSVYEGLMADYKVVWACGWTGCGCPRYVEGQPTATAQPSSEGSSRG